MDTDNEFLNWINSTPESELPSPEFDHTPLQSFEDGDFEDTPPLNDLVTPQLADVDLFSAHDEAPNAKDGSLEGLEGLFTMDASPDAMMSYWDYNAFENVAGTGVDQPLFPASGSEEALPLMGPPTNVTFGSWGEESPQAKRRKTAQGFVSQAPADHEEQDQETINPADMHVSPAAGFVDKEKDRQAMPPPSEVPFHLTSSNSGPTNSSPKARVTPPASASADTELDVESSKKNTGRKYTGTRPNLTVSKLIPLDAPVQTRTYVLPSSTSRKAIPTAFQGKIESLSRGKKRARSEVEDSPAEVPESPAADANPDNLEAAIQAKRLQNTFAARRSRARKLEYLKTLEDEVASLKEENDGLRGRVEELERIIMMGAVGGGGPT